MTLPKSYDNVNTNNLYRRIEILRHRQKCQTKRAQLGFKTGE
jgi:hypothetical protein